MRTHTYENRTTKSKDENLKPVQSDFKDSTRIGVSSFNEAVSVLDRVCITASHSCLLCNKNQGNVLIYTPQKL